MSLGVTDETVCRRIRVRGVVQGVGFRPFVWRLAHELSLAGWVRNDADGVEIEVRGAAPAIDRLTTRLRDEAPPRARVDALETAEVSTPMGADAVLPSGATLVASRFAILDSPLPGEGLSTAIGADTGVCPACIEELCTPSDRRYRYAFTTCTHCGPRYTIAASLPYDRARTSLAPFPLCPACAAEYRDPANRRFHAEATCCPDCGPRLRLCDARGQTLAGGRMGGRSAGVDALAADPIGETLARLRAGQVVAIKGLGGFHLACDARNAQAVATLRARKQREEKPFAVMVADLATADRLCAIAPDEAALLVSPERPVVLLAKRTGTDAVLPGVAPGLDWLGVMLPYTPLHVLLFHEMAGRPTGGGWLVDNLGKAAGQQPATETDEAPLVLVMTSANPGGEPLVIGDDEALQRLAGLADAFLLHDRAILARADDSVLRAMGAVSAGEGATEEGPHGTPGHSEHDFAAAGEPASTAQFLRRGRGFTPQAIRLARGGPVVLAFGGWYKNTVCVTRGDEAFLSAHVGDLDNAATCAYLDETVARLLDLLAVSPAIIAHDRHPDFHSSRSAVAFAAARGLPCVAVQHHHAHVAAVCAEHGVQSPVLGLALDGVGLGDDGGAWGGELLRADGARCQRLGHLRPLPLPGGDRAAREPWRMAAAALHALGRAAEIAGRFAEQPGAPTVAMMLARGLNTPPTSSAGRQFDAAAGLLGIKAAMAYEGQAAMLLEGYAAGWLRAHGPVAPLAGGWTIADGTLDLRPVFAHLVDAAPLAGDRGPSANSARGRLAALFHATLAAALAEWVIAAARDEQLSTVAAGGGCLLNHLLAQSLRTRLSTAGLTVLEARRAPPNDGGLALGQAWVALHPEM